MAQIGTSNYNAQIGLWDKGHTKGWMSAIVGISSLQTAKIVINGPMRYESYAYKPKGLNQKATFIEQMGNVFPTKKSRIPFFKNDIGPNSKILLIFVLVFQLIS